jgi:hypothetical protein
MSHETDVTNLNRTPLLCELAKEKKKKTYFIELSELSAGNPDQYKVAGTVLFFQACEQI